MSYCKPCDREVGIKTQRPIIVVSILFILGLVIPFWLITLPLFWIAAAAYFFIKSKKTCIICQGVI